MYENEIYKTSGKLIDEYKQIYKSLKKTHNIKLLRQLKKAVYSLDCNEPIKDKVWLNIVR